MYGSESELNSLIQIKDIVMDRPSFYSKGSGATSSSSSGSSSGAVSITKAMVKYEELKAVVGDAKWKINNLMDGRRRSRDAKIIVAEALRLVGSEPHYHLFFNNCEQI